MWLFLWITLSFWTLLFPGFFKGMYMIYALMMLTDNNNNNNNNSSNIELSCEPRQQLPDAHRLYGYGERQAVGWSGLRAGWIDAHECQDLSICITYERVNWKSIQVCEGLYCLPSPERPCTIAPCFLRWLIHPWCIFPIAETIREVVNWPHLRDCLQRWSLIHIKYCWWKKSCTT